MTEVDANLEAEARQALGGAIDELTPLAHGIELTVTRSVWRVRANGRTAICKVVGANALASSDPTHFRYWPREPLRYAQGVPAAYRAAGIEMPQLLDSFVRRDDDAISLWLDDVDAIPGAAWNVEQFGIAALRLGRAHGRAALGDADSAEPWLARQFLRRYLETWSHLDYGILRDDEAWAVPLVAEVSSPRLRAAVARLHDERAVFLGWLDHVPRTLCHFDFWPNNLFDAGGYTVLIDWGFHGVGALGEDIGNLVPDSVFDQLQPASALTDLDRIVFRNYVEGLRDSGWDGDERLVRLGMCASAVKYSWLAPMMLARAQANEHRAYGGTHLDDPREQYAARFAGLDFLAGWADEARGLAGELGLA
jgi:hypothetical protein